VQVVRSASSDLGAPAAAPCAKDADASRREPSEGFEPLRGAVEAASAADAGGPRRVSARTAWMVARIPSKALWHRRGPLRRLGMVPRHRPLGDGLADRAQPVACRARHPCAAAPGADPRARDRALWSVARRLRAGLVVFRALSEGIVATDVRAAPGPNGGLHGPDTGTMTRAATHAWARALDAQGRGAPWSQGPAQFLRRALERCQQAAWGDSRREEALRRALGLTRRPSGDDDRRRNAEILAPLDPWPRGLPALVRHWPESPRQALAR
jgi:hypothetical protein